MGVCYQYIIGFFSGIISRKSQVSFLIFFLLAQTACDLVRPATEYPSPTEEMVQKSFFFEADGVTPRTFLCGWASVTEAGNYSRYFNAHNTMGLDAFACNVQFEIQEKVLIAKKINPSFPDPKDHQWETIAQIPIRSHYYYEKRQDSRGRETNEYVRNAERSHWSARTHMSLDLSRTRGVFSSSRSPIINMDIWEQLDVTDVEWDRGAGFLGYTLTRSAPRL
jgi:hypothetical protein